MNIQKESTKFWIDHFYPKSDSEFKELKIKLDTMFNEKLSTNDGDMKLFNKKLNY
jgi:hypothetical protein